MNLADVKTKTDARAYFVEKIPELLRKLKSQQLGLPVAGAFLSQPVSIEVFEKYPNAAYNRGCGPLCNLFDSDIEHNFPRLAEAVEDFLLKHIVELREDDLQSHFLRFAERHGFAGHIPDRATPIVTAKPIRFSQYEAGLPLVFEPYVHVMGAVGCMTRMNPDWLAAKYELELAYEGKPFTISSDTPDPLTDVKLEFKWHKDTKQQNELIPPGYIGRHFYQLGRAVLDSPTNGAVYVRVKSRVLPMPEWGKEI